jgi:plastocyanin
VLALTLIGASLVAPLSAHAAQTLVVAAGDESRNGDVQLNSFGPNEIRVAVGDTVTWRLASTEFHNVLFPGSAPVPDFVLPGPDGVFINPAAAFPTGQTTYDGTGVAGSGLLNNKGDSYSITFTKAGAFPYVCSIHAGMGGLVTVVDAGQPVDAQPALDARRTAQTNANLATRALPAIMANLGELPAAGASAGISAGIQDGVADALRFFPPRITVKAGDAVTWIWKTQETPHTVTFLGGGAVPEVLIPHPQAGGPPRLELAPQVLVPAGDPTSWDGASYLNSGFLAPAPGQPTPAFTVHFANAGTFDYLCLLHPGMVGTIVVES